MHTRSESRRTAKANKIGYETAMRWTKGKYQFFVCTHIDKGHIHNHIYYNSTAQDCSRKFHNFIGSSFGRVYLSCPGARNEIAPPRPCFT